MSNGWRPVTRPLPFIRGRLIVDSFVYHFTRSKTLLNAPHIAHSARIRTNVLKLFRWVLYVEFIVINSRILKNAIQFNPIHQNPPIQKNVINSLNPSKHHIREIPSD